VIGRHRAYLDAWTELAGHYSAGRFDQALSVLAVMSADHPDRRASLAHVRCCLLCLTGESDEAMETTEALVRAGGWWWPTAVADPDLQPIRARSRFAALRAVMIDRAQRALDTARAASPRIILLRPPSGPPRAAVVALHMYGISAEETAAIWEPASRVGLLVAVPESSLRDADDQPCWVDNALCDRDVRHTVRQLRTDSAAPLILAGGSQGARQATRQALAGTIAGCTGFLAVSGAPSAESVSDALRTPDRPQVRGYLIVGDRDLMTLEAQRVLLAKLAELDIDCGQSIVAGMGHTYPTDFESLAETAVGHILSPTGPPR